MVVVVGVEGRNEVVVGPPHDSVDLDELLEEAEWFVRV